MKFHLLKITSLWLLLTVALNAQVATGRYITHKSTMATGRTMNNVDAVMECDGVKFVIPPEAIDDTSLLVYIYREEGNLIVKSGKPNKTIVRLAVDLKEFKKPVEIHIPMSDPDKIPVAYAVDKSDAWEPLTLKAIRHSSDGSISAIYITNKPVTVAWVDPE